MSLGGWFSDSVHAVKQRASKAVTHGKEAASRAASHGKDVYCTTATQNMLHYIIAEVEKRDGKKISKLELSRLGSKYLAVHKNFCSDREHDVLDHLVDKFNGTDDLTSENLKQFDSDLRRLGLQGLLR
jgi:hypothetical protein